MVIKFAYKNNDTEQNIVHYKNIFGHLGRKVFKNCTQAVF